MNRLPPPRQHPGRPAATSSTCSVGFRVSRQTRAASIRYAASAPTPGASAAPALMSSTPSSPWIPTSEPILRYRRIAGGDVLGHPVTKFLVAMARLALRNHATRDDVECG